MWDIGMYLKTQLIYLIIIAQWDLGAYKRIF